MRIVGVDFGTTNVRICSWDSEQDIAPDPLRIGHEDTATMPAVVALRREPRGSIEIIVGEDADSLQDDTNETLVINNIKRYALSSDDHVAWHLKYRNGQEDDPQWPPVWWNPDTHCVQAWGREYPVWNLIYEILAEAFRRAGLDGEFEWRAGCPVHGGFEYRDGLTNVLRRLTGTGDVLWITEEPILFLTLIRELEGLADGSYFVYDLGGGSFDCALVEISEGRMLVYGADGHPLLGGADLDAQLAKKLGYLGQMNLLRRAKERLTASNPSETLEDGPTITIQDVEATLEERGFVRKSVSTMRDAYLGAKVLWKRAGGEHDPPVGEIRTRDQRGRVRFVWQSTWDDLAGDVAGIVLTGGPTRSAHFRDGLSEHFGAEKIYAPQDLLPALTGTPDLELVGISMGACYSYRGRYSSLYMSRLPAHVTLEDLDSGQKIEYRPFENFSPGFKLFDDFDSAPLLLENALTKSRKYPQALQLTMTDLNGVVMQQEFVDKRVNDRLIGSSFRLKIDRFGRVGIVQESREGARSVHTVFEGTPWQTTDQKLALDQLFEQQRQYEAEAQNQSSANVNRLPWSYPTP